MEWSLQTWTKSGKVTPLLKQLRRSNKVTNLVGRLYSDFQDILYVFLLRGECKLSCTCSESSVALQFGNKLNVARHYWFRVLITWYDMEGKGCGSLLELLLSPEWFPCGRHWHLGHRENNTVLVFFHQDALGKSWICRLLRPIIYAAFSFLIYKAYTLLESLRRNLAITLVL